MFPFCFWWSLLVFVGYGWVKINQLSSGKVKLGHRYPSNSKHGYPGHMHPWTHSAHAHAHTRLYYIHAVNLVWFTSGPIFKKNRLAHSIKYIQCTKKKSVIFFLRRNNDENEKFLISNHKLSITNVPFFLNFFYGSLRRYGFCVTTDKKNYQTFFY